MKTKARSEVLERIEGWTDDEQDALASASCRFPSAYRGSQMRVRAIERRLAEWPESRQRTEDHPSVRVIALVRYPFRVFYPVEGDSVRIQRFRRAARGEA
jgi:hypothetical protein